MNVKYLIFQFGFIAIGFEMVFHFGIGIGNAMFGLDTSSPFLSLEFVNLFSF
jgi:hypothetical protein